MMNKHNKNSKRAKSQFKILRVLCESSNLDNNLNCFRKIDALPIFIVLETNSRVNISQIINKLNFDWFPRNVLLTSLKGFLRRTHLNSRNKLLNHLFNILRKVPNIYTGHFLRVL